MPALHCGRTSGLIRLLLSSPCGESVRETTRRKWAGMLNEALRRVEEFCAAYDMNAPIVMAPMAGACPPALAAAVAQAGAMGGCGALLMDPDAIALWAADFRGATEGPFQMNLWVPDPAPRRVADHERAVADFLEDWGPRPAKLSADLPVSFADQCEAL